MKRVNILYGGAQYSVGQADVDAIKDAVDQAHERGIAAWITVNFGEGRPQPAELLVGPGIPISIVPIPSDDPEPGSDGADDDAARRADVGGIDSPDDLTS